MLSVSVKHADIRNWEGEGKGEGGFRVITSAALNRQKTIYFSELSD